MQVSPRLARRIGRVLATGAALTLASATLVACGYGDGGEPVTDPGTRVGRPDYQEGGPGHNAIDVDFAQMLVVHTRQSVEMAALVPDRSDRPEVLALAAEVGQDDEQTITELSDLLASWGEPVPDAITLTDMDHTEMDHEGIGMGFMAGVMPAEKMTLLEASEGDQFDRLFLKLLQTHHGAAVAMAQSERLYGQSAESITLAKAIEKAQVSQMDLIAELLRAA